MVAGPEMRPERAHIIPAKPLARRWERMLISACLLTSFFTISPALAQETECRAYAQRSVDALRGSGDMMGDMLRGTMEGRVAGKQWQGDARGDQRGARGEAAHGLLRSIGNDPRAWKGFYDMAYQACMAHQMGKGANGGDGHDTRCRSEAGAVGANGSDRSLHVGSVRPDCR